MAPFSKRQYVVLILAVIGFLAALAMMRAADNGFMALSGGLGKLDMRMGYTAGDVSTLFSALGTEGLQNYLQFLLLDVFFVVCFAVVQSGVTKLVLHSHTSGRLVQAAVLAAWARSGLDLLENLLIFGMIRSYPTIHQATGVVASLSTVLKFLVLGAAAAAILALFVLGRIKPHRQAGGAVVVSESASGITGQFTAELAKALGADLVARNDVRPVELLRYDTIVYGGGVYAGRIAGAAWLSRLLPGLGQRRVIVFSTGFTPENRTDVLEEIRRRDFSAAQISGIRFFHITTGIRYGHLNPLHRLMLWAARARLLRQAEASLTESNRLFLQNYGKEESLPLPGSLDALLAAAKP